MDAETKVRKLSVKTCDHSFIRYKDQNVITSVLDTPIPMQQTTKFASLFFITNFLINTFVLSFFSYECLNKNNNVRRPQ